LFRLRNDLYCVEWGVKLYSLTDKTCGEPAFPVPSIMNSRVYKWVDGDVILYTTVNAAMLEVYPESNLVHFIGLKM